VNRIRLLIVDDDEVDRQALRRALDRSGVSASIEEVDSGAEALARIGAGGCDCVLLDYRLPGMNGLELLAELRRRDGNVPVVVLTGQGDERLAVQLMKAGAADYLAKQDLTPERLGRSLRHALAMADLTRLKSQLWEREQRARRDAEAENAAKDQFLATLSHELRTPLNVILGWSRLLKGGALPPGDVGRAFDAIERNAAALARHIDDLLDISRIVTGSLSLSVAPTEVGATVSAAVESMRPAAAARSIDLHVDVRHAGPAISVDPARLTQIVLNLVSNAIKFTPPGGRVDVAVTHRPGQVTLRVEDTGVGIPTAFLPHVFSRFQQADPSASRRHGGLGIGLSIVQQLVHLHGGTVTAESAGEAQGAAFTVTLPASRPSEASGGEAGPAADRRLAGIRVLMVDDEADARELVTLLLQLEGATVLTAASAAAARAALASSGVDVLVSDISMPEEDGYSLMETVRAGEASRGDGRLPAVALTAMARTADRERAFRAGFDDYLTKPVQAETLISAIEDWSGRGSGGRRGSQRALDLGQQM
jgi:signal transduction histidine kinase